MAGSCVPTPSSSQMCCHGHRFSNETEMKSVLVSESPFLEISEHSMGLETVSRVSWLPHQDEVLNENTQVLLFKKPLGSKIS